MRLDFAHQDEVPLVFHKQVTEGLVTEQIISEHGHVGEREGGSLATDPAFGSFLLTILLGMPILRRYKLWFQDENLRLAGGHDDGRDDAMAVGDRARRCGFLGAVRTGDAL